MFVFTDMFVLEHPMDLDLSLQLDKTKRRAGCLRHETRHRCATLPHIVVIFHLLPFVELVP